MSPNMNLKIARVVAGKSQLLLAFETKISQSRISLFERGFAEPSPLEARKIAKALMKDPKEIFRENVQEEAGG